MVVGLDLLRSSGCELKRLAISTQRLLQALTLFLLDGLDALIDLLIHEPMVFSPAVRSDHPNKKQSAANLLTSFDVQRVCRMYSLTKQCLESFTCIMQNFRLGQSTWLGSSFGWMQMEQIILGKLLPLSYWTIRILLICLSWMGIKRFACCLVLKAETWIFVGVVIIIRSLLPSS